MHQAFLNAGASALTSNSFCADPQSLARVDASQQVDALHQRAAELCREVAGQQALVLGSLGPGWLSPTRAEISLEELTQSYRERATALIKGGVDWLWIETVRDPLQAQAAVSGARQALANCRKDLPIAVLATVSNSGQQIGDLNLTEALQSLISLDIELLGLNCSNQPKSLQSGVDYLLKHSPHALALCPNAGLMDQTRSPTDWVESLLSLAKPNQIKVWGGCCGASPQHIQALAQSLKSLF